MRDSAGDGARVRSGRVVAVGRVSPCLLGAFLVVGGRRLDPPPAPFRPGSAIETARRSMAEQCRVGVDDVLGNSKWRRSRHVVLFGLGPTRLYPNRKSQARRFKSRFSCLGRAMQGLVWWSGVCTGSLTRSKLEKRARIWPCSEARRKHLVAHCPDNRLSDKGWWGPGQLAPHLSSRPLPAGHDVPSQPRRQPGACSAHQALSRGRWCAVDSLPLFVASHCNRGGCQLASSHQ